MAKTRERRCTRCGGQGGWRGWPGWTCYRCAGTGIDPTPEIVRTPEEEAKLAKRRQQYHDRKLRKAEEQLESNLNAHEGLREAFETAYAEGNDHCLTGFATDIMSKARRFDLTEKQAEAFIEHIDKRIQTHREREEAKVPAPEGRVNIEGKIATARVEYNHYGSTVKILLIDDRGFKVWVTLPSKIMDAEIGDRVMMTVTLTPTDDDPTFAIGKRPTKGEIV